ncbi:MAG: hypothetical protein CMF74_08330 [Maricaulis sp.]|jgi:hypothetical protein|nr:hypothetical protein [Maricaulis sp.]HAQ35464.1 DUF3168 domain-containing protein [Alphaproteobacteria bacterium]
MSAEAAFQDALIAHLSADAGVVALLGDPPRVFDEEPDGAAYPYVTIGRGVSEDADASGARVIEHRLTLHVWVRYGGRREAKTVVDAVRAAGHEAALSLAGGWRCVFCRSVYADAFRTRDSRIAHGVIRFRAMLEQIN